MRDNPIYVDTNELLLPEMAFEGLIDLRVSVSGTCVPCSARERFSYHASMFQFDWYDGNVANPMDHPDYQAIIAIGEDAIPFLIEEISVLPWLPALRAITGTNPSEGISDTDIDAQCARWRKYAQEHKIVAPPK